MKFEQFSDRKIGKSIGNDFYVHGEVKYFAQKKDPQIYHQKWKFVGDDYKGFDIEESKRRTKEYQNVISNISDETGQSVKNILSRIGTKSYWDKVILPRLQIS